MSWPLCVMKKAVESSGGGERSIETRRGGCLVTEEAPAPDPLAEGTPSPPVPDDAAGGHQAEGGEGLLSEPWAVRGLRFFIGRSGGLLESVWIVCDSPWEATLRVGIPGPPLMEGSMATEDKEPVEEEVEAVPAVLAGVALGETGSPGLRGDVSSGVKEP